MGIEPLQNIIDASTSRLKDSVYGLRQPPNTKLAMSLSCISLKVFLLVMTLSSEGTGILIVFLFRLNATRICPLRTFYTNKGFDFQMKFNVA